VISIIWRTFSLDRIRCTGAFCLWLLHKQRKGSLRPFTFHLQIETERPARDMTTILGIQIIDLIQKTFQRFVLETMRVSASQTNSTQIKTEYKTAREGRQTGGLWSLGNFILNLMLRFNVPIIWRQTGLRSYDLNGQRIINRTPVPFIGNKDARVAARGTCDLMIWDGSQIQHSVS
jgi:hypothetical protein